MPKANARIVTSVKPGLFHNIRRPNRTSCHRLFITIPLKPVTGDKWQVTGQNRFLLVTCYLSLVTVLFVSERDHRIDLRRTPRREITSGQCDQRQEQRDRAEG